MTAAPTGFQDAVDLLAEYKAARGVETQIPGITIGGGRLQFTLTPEEVVAGNPVSVSGTAFLGIMVSNESAPAQLPRPEVDKHADWLFYAALDVPSGTDRPIRYDGTTGPEPSYRGQRRMDEIGMTCWAILTYATAGENGVIGVISASTLLRLP